MDINLFVKDESKTMALMIALGIPTYWLFMLIIREGGQLFVLYILIFFVAALLFFRYIYINYISHLFNKFTPYGLATCVDEKRRESLKRSIDDLITHSNFSSAEIMVVDASSRTSHSNSAFQGVGRTKRIILFDTLFKDNYTDDHIVSVLAHEIGHYVLGHTHILLAQTLIQLSLMFGLFAVAMNNHGLLISFGFDLESQFVSLMVFLKMYECMMFVTGLLSSYLRR
jgi:STE24 endopeptidase